MKNKEKRKVTRSELLRYLRKGEMEPAEKHLFERELQKDPFAMEALEGMEGMDAEMLEKDLDGIDKSITRPVQKRVSLILRIAASLAILLVLSSVYVLIFRNKPGVFEAAVSENRSNLEIQKTEGIQAPAAEKEQVKEPSSPAVELSEPTGEKSNRQESGKADDRIDAIKEKTDDTREQAVVLADNKIVTEEISEMKAADEDVAMKKEKAGLAEEAAAIQGIATEPRARAADSEKRAPAISVRSAAYGPKPGNADTQYIMPVLNENEKKTSAISTPEVLPEGGWLMMDKYVSDNMVRPRGYIKGGNQYVTLRFSVSGTGRPSGFKITDSPGTEFSNEAVRLLKEGPAWITPGDGSKTYEVHVKVIFR